eukprot:GEMP01038336.1.p1 GENE.GEMP01038336.1~~GEMP01038336.1.p1  ORF type:complete len:442 (+),score=107.15 GEMP01038336.1:363-1688(+)
MDNKLAIYEENFLVKTFAGTRVRGRRDGPVGEATFYSPMSVAIDGEGNVFVADYENHCVRKISPIDGTVTTVAGAGSRGYRDGRKAEAQFAYPTSIAITRTGDLIVADRHNYRIRAISPSTGHVKTIAGCAECGSQDGPVDRAAFACPWGLALDAEDNIIVGDMWNNCIRMVSLPQGCVWTVAGGGDKGHHDGPPRRAYFAHPKGIAVGPSGDIFVADAGNNCVRKIEARTNTVSTLAGNGKEGWRDGDARHAEFNFPRDVAVDAHGRVIVADWGNHCIRRIDPVACRVTTIAGTGKYGFLDGYSNEAKFDRPAGIAVGKDGVIYVADSDNDVIRTVAECPQVTVCMSVLKSILDEPTIASTIKSELREVIQKYHDDNERQSQSRAAEERKRVCKICFERCQDSLFVPCGHLVCCALCANEVSVCPVCREGIQSRQRVYES